MRKSERTRPYPPALVASDTLAYLLDCSPSLVDDYVRKGHLPKPMSIGNLVRWDWLEVQRFLGILPSDTDTKAEEKKGVEYDDRAERYSRAEKRRQA